MYLSVTRPYLSSEEVDAIISQREDLGGSRFNKPAITNDMDAIEPEEEGLQA